MAVLSSGLVPVHDKQNRIPPSPSSLTAVSGQAPSYRRPNLLLLPQQIPLRSALLWRWRTGYAFSSPMRSRRQHDKAFGGSA